MLFRIVIVFPLLIGEDIWTSFDCNNVDVLLLFEHVYFMKSCPKKTKEAKHPTKQRYLNRSNKIGESTASETKLEAGVGFGKMNGVQNPFLWFSSIWNVKFLNVGHPKESIFLTTKCGLHFNIHIIYKKIFKFIWKETLPCRDLIPGLPR